jgi:endo-1,4-beta-xylanase
MKSPFPIILISIAIFSASFLVDTAHAKQTLRAAADARDFQIGVEVVVPALLADEDYRRLVAEHFNQAVPGNAFKFFVSHPAPDRYDFNEVQTLMGYTAAAGMGLHGHVLVWHDGLPDWVKKGDYSPRQLSRILQDFISTTIGHVRTHYPGRVPTWDVVNEAVNDQGTGLRDSLWRKIGPDYVAKAFRWAHAADPLAKLYYNDYGGEGLNPKSNAIYNMVRALRQQGVPIHGVGLQMHVQKGFAPPVAEVIANMNRLAALGLEIRISEMDYALPLNPAAKPADHMEQARYYREILGACLRQKACKAFVVWGATDRYSWVRQYKPGWGSAVIFDENLNPRPAYWALLAKLTEVR